MKNRKNKINVLKIGILFIGVSLMLWNCEKEEVITQKKEQVFEIKTKSFKDFKKNEIEFTHAIEEIDKIKNRKKRKDRSAKNENLYDFELDSTSIKKVTTSNTVSYTFLIKRKTKKNYFENLVLQTNNLNETKAFLFQYFPSSKSVLFGKSKTFDGDIKIIPLSMEKLNYHSKKTICNEITVLYCTLSGWQNGVFYSDYHLADESCLSHNSLVAVTRTVCYELGIGTGSWSDLSFDNENNNKNNQGGGNNNDNSSVNTSTVTEPSDTEILIKRISGTLNLNDAQKEWLSKIENEKLVLSLINFLNENNSSVESKNFAKEAIVFLKTYSQYTFEKYQNWFGTEHDGIDYEYDADYWENPNLTFTPQDLPSWEDFYASFPRKANGSGWLYGADNVYNLVGGDVLKARLDDVEKVLTNNTCALKVSIALNGAGIIIPEIITSTVNGKANYGTVKGADGKNYFLNAKSLNKWMKLTFGTSPTNSKHFNYTKAQGGQNGKNFPNLLTKNNKKGIYSLTSNNPKWASGHADIFFEDKCSAGCHFDSKYIESIDIWVLD